MTTLVLALIGTVAGAQAQEFEPIGGPYEPDSATVLLLHFDETLANASDSTENAQAFGKTQYVPHQNFPQGPGEQLGSALYIDNDAVTDSSYVIVPDTTGLDLTGSWTMELWVNVVTFGDTNDDHRWQPRIMFKPGEEQFRFSNYFINMFGDNRRFNTGYYTDSGASWVEVQSPNGLVETQTWYHVTYIRDTSKNVNVQMLHDADGNLLHFGTQPYNPVQGHPPLVNDNPLYIGTVPGQSNFWLDGLVDEVRISNVVRNFPVPPIISSVTQPPIERPDTPVEISTRIQTVGDADVSSAQLHYRVDGGTFQTLEMMQEADSFVASIGGQPDGTVVEYYIEATVSEELRTVSPAGATPTDPSVEPTYYSYAAVDSEAKVLHLTFDEGEGDPVDTGDMTVPVTAYGNPTYSEGKVGEHALYFEGDSTYLEVPAPERAFLNSRQFVIDFWFNADTVLAFGTQLIRKEGAPNIDDFNYQIWSTGGGDLTPATYAPGQGFTGGLTSFDSTYTPGEWHRVVYVTMEDTTFSQLYDTEGELIDENGGPIVGTVHLGTGKFLVGASSAILDADGHIFPNTPAFQGMMDDIRVYNYVPEEYLPTGVAADDVAALPKEVELRQNYPNPFNPTTTIQYVLPYAQNVSLTVYDVLGRKVATLVSDERRAAGRHDVLFDASHLSSGLYFYRLEAGDTHRVRKLLLVK